MILARHEEKNGKYFVDTTKGVMPTFLVEYSVGDAANNAQHY